MRIFRTADAVVKRLIAAAYRKQWLWAALCKRTRQIVGYVIGDRSELTFRRLLRKIPIEYLRCKSYSDYWKSYKILCSKGNHRQVGKEVAKRIILKGIGQH